MLVQVSTQADLENVCIDSTVVRAQACAAGAAASNATAETLGRSRGGFGCKIHALTDALGLPVRLDFDGRAGSGYYPSNSPHEEHWLHGRALG